MKARNSEVLHNRTTKRGAPPPISDLESGQGIRDLSLSLFLKITFLPQESLLYADTAPKNGPVPWWAKETTKNEERGLRVQLPV